MALSTATIAVDLKDYLGDTFDYRRTKLWASTNVPDETVHDEDSGETRVGGGTVTLAEDGTAELVVWVPGAGSNPASWQTYVHVSYADPGTQERKERTFGPFTVTEDAALPDLVAEQEVPPTYLTTVTLLLDGYVTDAETARTEAETAATTATSEADRSESEADRAAAEADAAEAERAAMEEAAAAIIAGYGVLGLDLDTDDVPYYDPDSIDPDIPPHLALLTDTDDVPYYVGA